MIAHIWYFVVNIAMFAGYGGLWKEMQSGRPDAQFSDWRNRPDDLL